jgi:hypothetical protein
MLRAEAEAIQKKPIEMEQKEYQTILEKFLIPFRDLLVQNYDIYERLIKGRGALEYHPNVLRDYFNSLPDTDRRKLYWYQRIKRLRKNNRQMLAHIQHYSSSIVTEDFSYACMEFWYHTEEWEDVWKKVEHTLIPLNDEEKEDVDPIPGDQIIGDGESMYANRFPQSLCPALRAEITEVKKLAGRTDDIETKLDEICLKT